MKLRTLVTRQENTTMESLDWKDVYDAFLPRIFHFFCYKTGDPQTAEDLTATTLEKAWANRSRYHSGRGSVGAWLFGIARHVAGDYFRRAGREIPLEEVGDLPALTSIAEDCQHRIDFQALIRILNQFPERERELIVLKYGAELTNREIAGLTGLRESNVGTILHRALLRLRKEWEQTYG